MAPPPAPPAATAAAPDPSVEWAVYRFDQVIFNRHIPLIMAGEYLLKSDTIGFAIINNYAPFCYNWQYNKMTFVLAATTCVDPNLCVGQVAIHDKRFRAEFPKGPQWTMELHVRLEGRNRGTGIPVAYFDKWFPPDSCSIPFPDGDLSAMNDAHFLAEWERIFPGRRLTTGGHRASLAPGRTTLCKVEFPVPFVVVPIIKVKVLSRNIPIWAPDVIAAEAQNITRHGFVMCLTIPENAPYYRVVAVWETVGEVWSARLGDP